MVGAGFLATALPWPAAALAGQSLELNASLASFYDDNILQYSQEQLRLFESGLRPDRYSLTTRDDGLLVPSLGLAWDLDRGHGRRHGATMRVTGTVHAKNGTADYRSLRVSWREQWSRNRRLLLAYSFLPRYYLRQLVDEDVVLQYSGLSRYRRAEFDLQAAAASWMQPVARSFSLEAAYRYENRKYNSDFRERDSGTHIARLAGAWYRRRRNVRVELSGGYQTCHARGDDGDEVPSAVDDVDISYHGWVGAIEGHMDVARRGPWRLASAVAYGLETRTFDSDRQADRYHFGRDDVLNVVHVDLRLAYRYRWSVGGFYHYENNRANLGAAAPLSADSGSYRQNQVGASIEFSHTLWRQAASEEEGGGRASD